MANGILDGYEYDSRYVAPLGRDVATGFHVQLNIKMMNRHGYAAGATGTGKSRTIQGMAEWLSQNGVSVVMADGKGDMSGMAREGNLTGKVRARAQRLGQIDCENGWWEETSIPVEFLALGGNGIGVPVRVPVGTFGHKSLAKVCGLSAPQSLALASAFLASKNDSEALETLDDLGSYLRGIKDDPESGVSPAVCDRILNRFAVFESENPGLFGGPEFDIMDVIAQDSFGWGRVSVIDSSKLADNPDVLTTFLLWLLDRMCDRLPEVGDNGIPKCVVFLDEAHLIFEDAPKEFTRGVVRTIKRLRSKGVGVFFCSQQASDIPDAVLSQCANRIQHALRANTPKELRELKKTADTFPVSKVYDIATELTQMPTGTALVCVMDDEGRPTPPSVCEMYVPRTSLDPLDDEEVWENVLASDLFRKYGELEAEHEMKRARARLIPAPVVIQRPKPQEPVSAAPNGSPVRDLMDRITGRQNGSQSREDTSASDDTESDPWSLTAS